ncbi:MAG: hypothetical protein RLZZ387_4445 [Chloroflexota bacterium]
MADTYADIEARFSPLTEELTAVTISGPGGDASLRFTPPAAHSPYSASHQPEMLGRALFEELFQGAARDVYQASGARLSPGQRLRLRLSIPAELPHIAALPWELLHDPARGPLALRGVSIVRFLALPTPLPQLDAPPALRVLLSAAQTPPPASIDRELRVVAQALAAPTAPIDTAEAPHLTTAALREHLRAGRHVWHFVGHGGRTPGGEAHLLFEDQQGDPAPVSPHELAALLAGGGVRLAVLSACHSAGVAEHILAGVAPALVAAGVPAVVAMQAEIPEEATRAFAAAFYAALAQGISLDGCVAEGRAAVLGAGGPGSYHWATPAVYTRLRDGHLLPRSAAPAAQPLAGSITVGDISGGVINVGGVMQISGGATVHMDDGTVRAGGWAAQSGGGAPPTGPALDALEADVHRELERVPPAHSAAAERIQERAALLLRDARQDAPDRDLLLYNARSLAQLAGRLAADTPSLAAAAARLAAWFEDRTPRS